MGPTDAADGGDGAPGMVSDADRTAAFDWARGQREARASVAASLASGASSLPDVLERACDAPWGSATLLFVLESLPAARKVDTRRALRRLGLEGDVALRDLDAADRDVVRREFPLPAAAVARDVGDGSPS